MLLSLIIASVPVGVILLSSEWLWRARIAKGERARKFIHILAGMWMAFWPYYLPYSYILLLGVAALALLLYSRVTNLFHAIYAVRRHTYGELFFALGIIVCAYLARADWVFATSILLLALADGGAAVVGKMWGRGNQYKVFGSSLLTKSIAGTAAYCILAFGSISIGVLLGGTQAQDVPLLALVALPFGLAIVENASPYGVDNLLTPLFAMVALQSFARVW